MGDRGLVEGGKWKAGGILRIWNIGYGISEFDEDEDKD
jgi:hypothetical protein